MALTSSSTRDDVLAAYLDNADYEAAASTAKCKDFIQACMFLLTPKFGAKRISVGGRDGETIELDLQQIRDELRYARQWLHAHAARQDGGTGVVKVKFAR